MDKTFEMVLHLNIQGAQWPRWRIEVSIVLFTALFRSQHPSSLSVPFIISQSMGWFQNCRLGFAAQSSWEATKLLSGVVISLTQWAFCRMSELRLGPMPEACAKVACYKVASPGCPAEGNDAVENNFCFVKAWEWSRLPLSSFCCSNVCLTPGCVPICVILLTEKEGISTWTCHILWPAAHWDGRWWQNKQHSFSECLSDLLRKIEQFRLHETHQHHP